VSIHEATSAHRLTAPPSRAMFVATRAELAKSGTAESLEERGATPRCGNACEGAAAYMRLTWRATNSTTNCSELRLKVRKIAIAARSIGTKRFRPTCCLWLPRAPPASAAPTRAKHPCTAQESLELPSERDQFRVCRCRRRKLAHCGAVLSLGRRVSAERLFSSRSGDFSLSIRSA
jgi:hypothetical protein